MSLFEKEFWIPIEECTEDYDVVVVAELTRRARGWGRFGLSQDDFCGFRVDPPQAPEPRMYLGVDLVVDDGIMRAFRVDVHAGITLVGEDSTKTYEYPLKPNDDGVLQLSGAPSHVADAAADWLERELSRVIERREWDVRDFCYRRWYLRDTQTALAADGRIFRFVPEDLGPPDRIIQAHPPIEVEPPPPSE